MARFSASVTKFAMMVTSISIVWLGPLDGYFKLNTEGSSHENPGPDGGGRILRDSNGDLVFAFTEYNGSISSL